LKWDLGPIATIHTITAFALVVFTVVHVYMTTTGTRWNTNIKAMISGYEELEVESS